MPVANAASEPPEGPRLSHHREQVMGTVVTIDVFGEALTLPAKSSTFGSPAPGRCSSGPMQFSAPGKSTAR